MTEAPMVVRLTASRLALLLVALVVLVALGTYSGFRLGRGMGESAETVRPSSRPDAPMVEGGREEAAGFQGAVDLSAGFAVIVLRTASADEARRVRDEVGEKGLPARIDQDPRRPRDDRFRVLAGPFADRAAAMAAGRSLGGEPGETDVVFVE